MRAIDIIKKVDKRLALSYSDELIIDVSESGHGKTYHLDPNDPKAQEIVAKINELLSEYKFSYYYETDMKHSELIACPSYVERRNNITAAFDIWTNFQVPIRLQRYVLIMCDDKGQKVYTDAELFKTAAAVDKYIENEKKQLNVKIDDYINELRSAYIYACTQLNKQ